MKHITRYLPTILTLTVVVGGLIWGFWPTAIDVEVAVTKRGAMQISVRDDGETRIREKFIVSAPVTGRMRRMELHAGDLVERDQTVLVRIDPADPSLLDARAKAESEARVQVAQAALDQARTMLKQRDEGLALAQHAFDRADELRRTQALAVSDYDRAEHQLRMAQADRNAASFGLTIAEFEHELAKAALIFTRGDRESENDLAIRAPIDGQVLRILQEDAGTIAAGTPIVEIGDPRQMEMKIDLLSTDAVRVRPGAKVTVEHWGQAQTLTGRVRVVEPSAFLKVSALGVEEKRVNVLADFSTPFAERESLGDGYRIEARIVVEEISDGLKIPAGALVRFGDQWSVYRLVNGRAYLTPIVIGETDGHETAVVRGLDVGDLVILYPTDKITNGVRVRTR